MAAFMARNDLHDVGIIGPKFTWCNNKSENARILERLDRCLLNSKALNMIQNAVDKLFHTKQIKFEEVWASFPASKGIVLKSWNKPVKGNDMDIINVKCKRRSEWEWNGARETYSAEIKIHEFNLNLARLSTWWRQRTKLKWIQDNDTNSRFFQSFANGRRMGNLIHQLKNDEGNLVENQAEIEEILLNFFNNKWKKRNGYVEGWPPFFNSISAAE
ncbi:uncharacterized protein LOC110103859 [Dendrobium catenatum]|uniref:uncharacterized protein LOC110103859 n=1 Tax=Dendrobium catenatum TaxID=906689 RepID=UPI0009F4C17D|nr:uncharacterized protein LOC110103859 [Dendrobium catenatum]